MGWATLFACIDFQYERSEIGWPSEKYVCATLEAAILFSFWREMGQITLRKSTTGTVVNHKEESSLRGEEFVIGGESGQVVTTCPNVWRFPVRLSSVAPIFIVIWKLTKGWPQPGQSVGSDGEMIAGPTQACCLVKEVTRWTEDQLSNLKLCFSSILSKQCAVFSLLWSIKPFPPKASLGLSLGQPKISTVGAVSKTIWSTL